MPAIAFARRLCHGADGSSQHGPAISDLIREINAMILNASAVINSIQSPMVPTTSCTIPRA